MDRMAVRKMQLSEESGQVYEKANKLFDEWQNEIVFLLAKEYLENGKIDPQKKVIDFLVAKGAKGFNSDTNESVGDLVMSESTDEYLFPYSFEIDGTQTGCVLRIEKIKEPQNPSPEEVEVQSSPVVEVDPILQARNAR